MPKSAKNSLIRWNGSQCHRSLPASSTLTPILGNHCPIMWKSPLYPVRANTTGSCTSNMMVTVTVCPGATGASSGTSITVSSGAAG